VDQEKWSGNAVLDDSPCAPPRNAIVVFLVSLTLLVCTNAVRAFSRRQLYGVVAGLDSDLRGGADRSFLDIALADVSDVACTRKPKSRRFQCILSPVFTYEPNVIIGPSFPVFQTGSRFPTVFFIRAYVRTLVRNFFPTSSTPYTPSAAELRRTHAVVRRCSPPTPAPVENPSIVCVLIVF